MVMKPVRLLCYLFLWTWKCTTFKRIPIIFIVLTNKNVALIYSVTICQQKTKDCALSGCFQHKRQYCCFYHWCLPLFITSLLYQLCPEWKFLGGRKKVDKRQKGDSKMLMHSVGWSLIKPFVSGYFAKKKIPFKASQCHQHIWGRGSM